MDSDEDPVDSGITFIEHIQFDKSCRFLIGHGQNQIFVLDMQTMEKEFIKVSDNTKDKIYDLRFLYDDFTQQKQCYVAHSNISNSNQIVVYDVFEK